MGISIRSRPGGDSARQRADSGPRSMNNEPDITSAARAAGQFIIGDLVITEAALEPPITRQEVQNLIAAKERKQGAVETEEPSPDDDTDTRHDDLQWLAGLIDQRGPVCGWTEGLQQELEPDAMYTLGLTGAELAKIRAMIEANDFMSTTHTPAPWEIQGSSICSEENCIAVIEDDGGYECPAEQRQSNARLIAAAPDLLAACKRLLKASLISGPKEFCDARDACEAAIAKAEGAEEAT